MKKIGLALGGGGARGLAHIPMLEVFDELGVRPHRITGTSIGAIIGAVYASGIAGSQIREHVQHMVISKGESFWQALKNKDVFKWIEFLDVEFGSSALFKGDRFIEFLYEAMGVSTFEELQIPLSVVATDFWSSRQVVLDAGSLLPAVKASMALPGVFTPVELNGRVLIDGGSVNPVPYDLLDDCDVLVAVDVIGPTRQEEHRKPNLFRAVLGTFDIMHSAIVAAKVKCAAPDIFIRPDICGVDLLEFHKADDIFEQAQPARERLKQELERSLRGGRSWWRRSAAK